MASGVTVLVTAVGSGVAHSIIKALRLANKQHGRNYRLLGTDMRSLAAGLYRVDKGFIVPGCSEPGYFERLIAICRAEEVDIVIPGSDPEVVALAEGKTNIEAATSAQVLVSSPEAARVGYDKWLTYLFLRDNGFLFPLTVKAPEVSSLLSQTDFPLIAKPRSGSGSAGLYRICDQAELGRLLPTLDDSYVIQECLMPEDAEYTTGIVFDTEGQVIDSITMWRRLKKGASYFAKVVDCPEVQSASESIASRLKIRGSVNIQCRLTERGPVAFEINTRFSGTAAARAVAGLNEADISIRNLLWGERPARSPKAAITMMRHLMEIYVQGITVEKMEQEGVTETKAEVYDYF